MTAGLQSKTCPYDRGTSAVNFACRDADTFTEKTVPLNPILSLPLCFLIYEMPYLGGNSFNLSCIQFFFATLICLNELYALFCFLFLSIL